jgi:hypothetical protein
MQPCARGAATAANALKIRLRSIAMARYAPEFLIALRHRYEKTDQPMRSLALEFGIGISTLSALVEKEGWQKRSQRQRGSPAAPGLAEASALLAALPPRGSDASPASEESMTASGANPTAIAPPADDERSAAVRLEALLLQEIAAEEAARAELGTLPRLRAEADGCARRLATLTQTLKALRAIPATPSARQIEYDDMPEDIDEFRENLARRIEAFMESRVGKERMALDRQFARLTDDELAELAAVGRERGMPALLRPLEDEADDLDEWDRAHAAHPQAS